MIYNKYKEFIEQEYAPLREGLIDDLFMLRIDFLELFETGIFKELMKQ